MDVKTRCNEKTGISEHSNGLCNEMYICVKWFNRRLVGSYVWWIKFHGIIIKVYLQSWKELINYCIHITVIDANISIQNAIGISYWELWFIYKWQYIIRQIYEVVVLQLKCSSSSLNLLWQKTHWFVDDSGIWHQITINDHVIHPTQLYDHLIENQIYSRTEVCIKPLVSEFYRIVFYRNNGEDL